MIRKSIILFAAAAVLASCSHKYVKPATSSYASDADANLEFALDFFKKTNQTLQYDENVIVSPYSAGVALSMLEEGAEGETKAEFENVLNGHLFGAEDLGSNDEVIVKSTNSLWISDDFSIRNRYVNLLEKDFDALVTTQNFSDPATVQAINNWCSEHTAGKIEEIIDELSPNDVMVLVNALYFNAPWAKAFNPELTAPAIFHGVVDDKEVSMMYSKGKFSYAEYQGCQLIKLPYAGGRYSMTVVLPPYGWGIDNILPYVNGTAYKGAMQMLTKREVIFKMPKFKLETSLVLDKALKKMGIETAYTPAADFKGISAMGPLSLGTVKQKCYIDVTEKGTEAAAVTSAQVSLTSLSPNPVARMTVDRPFIFIISDSQTNNILFVGKVVNL
jgi:serpin B